MDREQKQQLKVLHNFFSYNYKTASEAYLNGYLTSEDIDVYVENEQSVAQRINSIRKKLDNAKVEEQYKLIASGALPVDTFIEKLQNDLKILELEYNKLIKADAFTPEEAKQKLDKIQQFEKRIEHYNKLINDLQLSKEEYKPKKKPGRPKKQK